MSSSRLLILGVLRFKQPTHGYEIRRELESWGADRWANIAYGSIYHALNQMSKEGLITPVVHHDRDRVNNRPARTSYALTEGGEFEFQRLLREFWWESKPVVDPFQVALAFMPGMDHDELMAALRHRAGYLKLEIESCNWAAANIERTPAERKTPLDKDTPRHVAQNKRLVAAHAEAELRWVEQTIEKVERGELP